MSKIDLLRLIASLVICQAAGFIGSLFTSRSIPGWYETLKRPSFAPPNWVFSPVWITLFVLMGIALFFVWRMPLQDKSVRIAIILFGVQLILNILWSVIFFGLRSPFLALMEIVILWIAVLLTVIAFFKVSRIAGALMLPYILWVSFAALLNFYFWKLN